MNNEQIKAISNKSVTATTVMVWFAMRQRHRELTNIQATRAQLLSLGEKIVDDDYYQLWKDLEAVGVGRYVVGKQGQPDRFKWNYSLRSIARIAIDSSSQKLSLFANSKQKVVARIAPLQKAILPVTEERVEKQEQIAYIIELNQGRRAEVFVPKDVQDSDIKHICRALMA